MSEALVIVLASAALNGAVTWGVVSTKLAWLRRDVDQLDARLTRFLERTEQGA